MKCWICGSEANTGEHRTKASDLKSEFGKISQQNPLYLHTKEKRNVKVNSIKRSKALKSDALICANCNNAETSAFDKAWESLSNYLRGREDLRKGSIVKLDKIFPGKVKDSMLNVHLYFVKLFGCAIKEHHVPIDLSIFSQSVLNKKAHPKVHICIGITKSLETGNTDLQTANLSGKCAFATWFYIIGNIAVNVMYAEPNEKRKGLINSWHPTKQTKRLCLSEF